MAAMGMMHEGYFVGRNELSDWIRGHFDPGFNKIEDLASGVVYCKIINSIYPGSVALQKVKKDAKIEVDFIHNFKILQNAFSKKKIDRYIDVDKLTKRSFQFNMEFLQFMKAYHDLHAPGGGNQQPVFKENSSNSEPAQPKAAPRKAAPTVPGMITAGAARRAPARAGTMPTARAPPSEAVNELQLEVTELKCNVDNLERERDFYYAKLREIEVLCQQHEKEQPPFLAEVMTILYKTDEADEFVAPAEVAEVAQAEVLA